MYSSQTKRNSNDLLFNILLQCIKGEKKHRQNSNVDQKVKYCIKSLDKVNEILLHILGPKIWSSFSGSGGIVSTLMGFSMENFNVQCLQFRCFAHSVTNSEEMEK